MENSNLKKIKSHINLGNFYSTSYLDMLVFFDYFTSNAN